MIAAASVCLVINLVSMLRRLDTMRSLGFDPHRMSLMDALQLFGWQTAGIWVALIAFVLVFLG